MEGRDAQGAGEMSDPPIISIAGLRLGAGLNLFIIEGCFGFRDSDLESLGAFDRVSRHLYPE
jgi:hypothetical protein